MSNGGRLIILSGVFVLCIFQSAAQEVTGDTLKKINAIFKKWDTKQSPGAVLAISRNGKLIYNNAWGMANVDDQIPNTITTAFDAASVTKQFVAAGILLLEQQKKLSLEDDVRKYVSELSITKDIVRLRDLIHHTSGLREWNNTFLLTGWERGTGNFGNDGILEIISKQKQLVHTPGAEFNYVNANYNLLAIVIERVSKMSLAAFYKNNFFVPLGLSNTYWNDFLKHPDLALGYTGNQGIFKPAVSTLKGLGPGGILTTPADLIKWNHQYLSGALGGQQFLEKQLQQGILNNGVTIPYAAGLSISNYKGHKTISHDGQGTGYSCFTESYPELGLSFVLMSNTVSLPAISTCRQVEALFIPPKNTATKDTNWSATEMSPQQLTKFTGWYKNTRTSAGLLLMLKNNFLLNNNGDTLQAVSPVMFRMGSNMLKFSKPERSSVQLISSLYYPDTVLLQPVLPPEANGLSLMKYTGVYLSDELGSRITIAYKNDSLQLQLPGGKFYKLKPLYKDGFISEPSIVATSPTYVVYEYKNGVIAGMRISLYRSRNNFFKKT